MRNTNMIGIFLATIAVIAGCQMADDKEATQAVSASPTPTTLELNIEFGSNTTSGSIGITPGDLE